MNETIRELMERKSVRVYENEPIPETDVQTILEAAVQAPSAGNMNLWSIIRVTDEKKKQALSESCDHQPFIATAPLVLVFCADYKRWFDAFAAIGEEALGEPLRKPAEGDFLLATVDTVIAAHTAVTAAQALGYGSCYIGDIIEHCDEHRALLGLPAYVKPVCMAVFGKPTQQQIERKKPARFDVSEVVFENEYRDAKAEGMRAMLEKRQEKTGEEFDRWLLAFVKRKWNCDFSEEMSRSAAQMIREWNEGK